MGIYNRRYPELTDYYRIIESSFDEFERRYPDLFESKYGYLRAEIMKAIYAFLECGIPENGVARIWCETCGDDFFVAYSCRKRAICASCGTKRSLLFGEKVSEIAKPISHIHITFTIPKILRAYFKRNRKLLKLLTQSANYAVDEYFKEALGETDGIGGGIYCVQTQGNLFNYHPHIHALVIPGIIKDGVFIEQTNISTDIIARLFRARLLSVLLKDGVINQGLVDMLISWNHNSGFNVHIGRRIKCNDSKSIENTARYMSKAAISCERVVFNREDSTVTVYEKAEKSPVCKLQTYDILEFIALIASHIPRIYESLVYYYGVYSSSHRGRQKRENEQGQELAVEEVKGKKGESSGKVSSTWARLIQRIFEVNPLCCRKCGGEMKIIAFITTVTEVRKILKHIGEETKRPPPLNPEYPEDSYQGSLFDDYISTVDEYICDVE